MFATADLPRAGMTSRKESMAQKQQRGNREAKKPKQDKKKVAISASPFAAASHTNPGKSAAASKRK